MRYRLRTLLIVLAIAGLILGCADRATMDGGTMTESSAPQAVPRQIAVRLLGPAEEISGIQVPSGLADQPDTYLRVDEPADVIVRFGDDRAITMRVRYVSVNVSHGVVVDVHLLPLSKSLPFRDVVAKLHRIMREMGIEPDEKMRNEIATWPDNSRDFTFRTGMWLSESVGLGTEVRPSDGGEHYLALTFAVRANARRVLWDPAAKSVPNKASD